MSETPRKAFGAYLSWQLDRGFSGLRQLTLFVANAFGRRLGTGQAVSHSRGELSAGVVDCRTQGFLSSASRSRSADSLSSEFHANFATEFMKAKGRIDNVADDCKESDCDQDLGRL